MTTTTCPRGPACPGAGCGTCALIARDSAYAAGFAASKARPAEKPARRAKLTPVPHAGVGTELTAVLKLLGLGESAGCSCKKWQRRMDAWGVAGCRERRAEIEDHLRGEAKKVGWARSLVAGAKAVAAGLVLNPLDPAPGLLNEAIRRAEAADPPPLLAPLRLVEVPQAGLVRGDTGAINASILRHRGRLLMAYRSGVNGARIHVAELAEDYRVVRSVPLSLPHPRAASGQEDPRLTTVRGGLRVWFYGHERAPGRTTMLYADVSDDLVAGPVRCPAIANRQEPKEKNWAPFEHDGEQYVVYTVSPHVVARIDGETAERVYATDAPFPWAGGHLRGGAPPVLVGDRFYHWFHGSASPKGGLPGSAADSHYNVGLYTFEARPPFRVLAMTPAPVLWGSRAENVSIDRCPYHAVAFPCGAAVEDGVWKVSMGWNDRRIMVAEWDADAVADLIGAPPVWFDPRPDTTDREIYREVVTDDCYGLAGVALAGGAVVDVGAHIGTFALAASRRGAAAVHCYEPCPDNVARLRAARLPAGSVVPHPVRGAGCTLAYLHPLGSPANPGTRWVTTEPTATPVGPAVGIREAVCRAAAAAPAGRVAVLKLDCEGSEWPILAGLDAGTAALIDRVVGEWHPPGGPADLRRLLGPHGFEVTTREAGGGRGVFAAARR